MAQINITLDEKEILQLLSENRDEGFKQIFQDSLNSILKAESKEQLQAEPYERSEQRTDSRNGFRERTLNTRIGSITLEVPRHRNVPFKSLIFDNYARSESALITTMAEMVVNGVSTRKVSKVMETLCETPFSKSTVSEVCKDLDEVVHKFKTRPLDNDYPFLIVDATYFKVREKHQIISKAFMIAYGVNSRGEREILGFDTFRNESNETWDRFFASLIARGLKGVDMITSDAHEGILNAIQKHFPDVPWQRCQFHFVRNIMEKTPTKYQAGLKTELNEMFNCETREKAYAKKKEIMNDYYEVAEAAMECLDNGFDSAMTVMMLPERLRKKFRTSNRVERINRELKRRSKVIGVFPNEMSINRLMGSVLIELNEKIQEKYRMFYTPVVKELELVKPNLVAIAKVQRQLRIA